MKFQYKLLATAILLAAAASTQAQIYKVTLNGASENPPVTSNGTGTAVVTVNATTHELRVKATFGGLNSNTTASHIHCCVAAPTANAGVVTATPSFVGFPLGVQSGGFDATYNTTLAPTWNAAFVTANAGSTAGAEASFINGVATGGAYLNIHTTTSPGGEIRGTVQRFSFATGPTVANSNVGLALDSLGAGTGALNERLVNMAMLGTNEQLTAAQRALLPIPGSMLSSLAANGLFSSYDEIGNHLGRLRDDKGSSNGAWGRVASHDNSMELVARGADAEGDGWDVIVGVDVPFNSVFMWGASLSYSDDSYGFNRSMFGSSGSSTGWAATLYGEYLLDNVFIDGMVTAGRRTHDLSRNTGMTTLLNSASDADQWGARLAAGIKLELAPNWSLTPQARIDWSGIDIDGYTESGTDSLALRVSEQTLMSTQWSVGAQADWQLSATINPFLRLFWRNESKEGPVTTTATFVGGGNAFMVQDTGPASTSYLLGVGVNIFSGNNFSTTVSYDLRKSDDFESNMFQAKLLWRF